MALDVRQRLLLLFINKLWWQIKGFLQQLSITVRVRIKLITNGYIASLGNHLGLFFFNMVTCFSGCISIWCNVKTKIIFNWDELTTTICKKKEMTSRLSDPNLVATHTYLEGCTSIPQWIWLTSVVCKSAEIDADGNFEVLAIIRTSDHLHYYCIATSPGVFNQQRLDEVNSQGGDPIKCVLRVVYIDLGDVEECLLLVVTQEGRLAGQHDVCQYPDTPGRKGRKKEKEVKRLFVISDHYKNLFCDKL